MTTRKVALTDKAVISLNPTPCPKCGNFREFVAHSDYCAEDCCNVWVECGECGFDPTQEDTGYRLEDVWGGCGDNNIIAAISCWDDALRESAK